MRGFRAESRELKGVSAGLSAVEERCESIKAAADQAVAKIMQQLKMQLLQLPKKVCPMSTSSNRFLMHEQTNKLTPTCPQQHCRTLPPHSCANLPLNSRLTYGLCTSRTGAQHALQGVLGKPAAATGQHRCRPQRSSSSSGSKRGQQTGGSTAAVCGCSNGSTHHPQLAQQSSLRNSSSSSGA